MRCISKYKLYTIIIVNKLLIDLCSSSLYINFKISLEIEAYTFSSNNIKNIKYKLINNCIGIIYIIFTIG